MTKFKKVLAVLLVLVMVLGMAACGKKTGDEDKPPVEDPVVEPEKTTPLVVGYNSFSSKFSPFFSETAYDADAAGITQIGLLNSDRTGAIIYKGIKGETINYNGTDYTYYGPADLEVIENADGTVDYNFVLRDDLVFSDGEPLTVDDIIFSMYVLCDPTYDGSSTLFALPITGMQEYRSGMDSVLNLILATERAGYVATDFYTEEQYDVFWEAFDAAGINFVTEIKEYIIAAGYGTDADPVETWAAVWGYKNLPAGSTEADFFAAIVEEMGYDLSDNGINYESAGTSISAFLNEELGDKAGEYAVGVQTGASAPNIAGIVKNGDYSLTIKMDKIDATAIYQLGVTIAPLHYYGDKAQFNYANNQFGFPKGDLSMVRAKTTQPMGAGPYKFIKFENGVIYYEANETYFQGGPKTKYLNFLECKSDDDKLNGVITGTIDIADPSFSTDNITAIKKTNGGELVGPVITTNTVDNRGYGYIGINANLMCINGEPASEASKNFRKAFGTIYSVYRDLAIDSYYGDRASVINYPISNTSWAAPRSTDAGYKIAFSVDVDGNDIYTSGMKAEDKYVAAREAALGFFEAAGFTVADGKVTGAPAGMGLEYEVWIPADGSGDHPAFMILTEARDSLAEIGITLVIRDLTNSADLWTGLQAKEVPMWCAAWQATVDPDMYQIYFSGDDTNKAGGSNYMYAINDAELNQLILDARMSTDQTYRKSMYKACLDIIIDWAVEVPTYQRQNAVIFSTERVNIDTITPDITTFYGWMAEIENTELN